MKKIFSLFLLLLPTCFGLQQAAAQAPATPTTTPKVGVNTRTPSEVLHVNGTTRLENLPSKGATGIYTKPDGTVSNAADQVFLPSSVVVADGNGVLGKTQTPPNLFFYMPAVYLPAEPTKVKAPVSYNTNTGVYTLNLYNEYKEQYSLAGAAVKSPSATTLPFETSSSNLNYFVTYYDNTVFESVAVNNSGVLTYKVKDNAVVSARTFMNIVLSLRN